MRKLLSALAVISVIFLLTACGGAKNGTSLEAAQTLMKGMVKGDSELIDEINHSDAWSYPTHYMIDIANRWEIIDADLKSMKYNVDANNECLVHVQYTDSEGNEEDISLRFNKESDGYYFTKID